MEIYSDGSSKTTSDNQLEYTEIERLVCVNDEDDDVLDTCKAAEGLRWGDGVALWTHTRFKPSLDAFIEEIPASWSCSLVFKAIQRGMETATVAARWAAKQDAIRKRFESSMRSWARRAAR